MHFNRHSLTGKLVIFTGATLVLMSTTVLVLGNLLSRTLRQEVGSFTKSAFSQLHVQVSAYLDESADLIRIFSYNEDVRSYLTAASDAQRYEYFKKVDDLFLTAQTIKTHMKDLILINRDGHLLSLGGKIYDEAVLSRRVSESNTLSLAGIRSISSNYKVNADNGGNLLISCPVSERKAAGVRETLGYICFILDLKPIMALMESLRVTKSAEFVLTDEAGNFISGTKNGAGLWDIMKERPIKSNTESFEQGYYCLSHGLDTSDFSFYCFIPEKEFFSYAGTMKKYVGLLILLNICIVAAMAVYMNRSMGKPIKQLLWTIHEVRDGDVVVRSGSRDQGEIGNLARNFDEMMDRVTMLSQESIKNQSRMYELMLRRNEMELIALQNQINPHFLYNTLACIRGIAICNRQTEIAAVTKALAKIYNYILRSPEIVTVREEITIVESFMDIYKVRIGSRVSGTVQIDEKLMDQKIMKLLIQPLVENAMEHGICQKIDGGTVKILGTGGTERMRFVIEDDGCGMVASQVEALNRIAAEGAVASNGERRKKYGMYNIITRLKLMYGHGFLFRCESRKDAGTRITVEIPYTMPEGLEVPADVEGSDDRR